MRMRTRIITGLLGVLTLAVLSLPIMWNQPDPSGRGLLEEALAGADEVKAEVQEHLDLADQYDRDAKHHEAEAQRYGQKVAAITALMDPKGFRRNAMRMAEDAHTSMAHELRFRAKVHRLQAELLLEKSSKVTKAQ